MTADPDETTPQRLKFLGPGWFASVMGLSGLALAWHRAQPLMGEGAEFASRAIGAAAAAVFVLLLLASLLRLQRHPQALAEDLRHPVRHPFAAAFSVSVVLVATVGTALLGPSPALRALWMLGCLLQLGVTVWVLSRWWAGNGPGGLQWAGTTPILIVPIVGNVLAPLAGVALGQTAWATAQFGIGLFLWPLVMALLVVRIGIQGLWPERLLPTGFITIAPPAVIGLSLANLGAPIAWSWACWGIALFFLLWMLRIVKRMLAQPFALPFWALSFPLAAFAALTLRLADGPGPFAWLAVPALALASLVIAALCLGTWRGLRDGSLLAPEVVASLQPAQP